jgi:hypothetical protein
MRSLTYEIKKEEYVGDSIAKYNYNFLILDTKICNLNSTFFTIKDNFKQIFDILESNKQKYDDAYNKFNNEQMFRYDKTYSIIQILSSYWEKHEFSICLNFNLSKTFSNIKKNVYTKPTTVAEFEIQRKKCIEYLNAYFPATSFSNSTTANVVVYYNSIGNDDPIDSLRSTWINDFSNFFPTIKDIQGTFTKNDINIYGVNVFKFENSNYIWNLLDIRPTLSEQKLNLKIDTISKIII